MLERNLTVGRSKTPGGEERMISLNQNAFDTLVEWRAQFDNPLPDHFVFPAERYRLDGEEGYKKGAVAVWNLDPQKPIGSWKVAWTACWKSAGSVVAFMTSATRLCPG